MGKRLCEKCYHWQGYGYCAIYDTLQDDCESFIEEEGVRFYFRAGKQV